MADYIKPVVFQLGSELYGVDIGLVQSIEEHISVVPVPNAVSYIKGIVNMRGEVIPVFSLKRKFQMEDTGSNGSSIIAQFGGMKIALEVDAVNEIGNISAENIVPMPSMIKTAELEYMDRVANVNGKLIVLLDVTKILTDDETEKVKKMAEELSK